jgi:hypothetical protein
MHSSPPSSHEMQPGAGRVVLFSHASGGRCAVEERITYDEPMLVSHLPWIPSVRISRLRAIDLGMYQFG